MSSAGMVLSSTTVVDKSVENSGRHNSQHRTCENYTTPDSILTNGNEKTLTEAEKYLAPKYNHTVFFMPSPC